MKIDARKLKRRVFGFLSFSTALFVFQACYGTPQDFQDYMMLEGKVVSTKTAKPVAGIKVSTLNPEHHDITGDSGRFVLHTDLNSEYFVSFEDLDPEMDGNFTGKDTLIVTSEPFAYLYISLEEK